jgi:hypothetical protein
LAKVCVDVLVIIGKVPETELSSVSMGVCYKTGFPVLTAEDL